MEFAIKNEFKGFAKLIPGTVDYLQAMPENDLYFIQDTRFKDDIQQCVIFLEGCVRMKETRIAKKAS